MKKKIWISGSTGFIGKNLVPLFVNDDIYRFSNNPIFKNDTEINFIDYSNKDCIYKYIKNFGIPDVFIHLAWGGRIDPQNKLLKQQNLQDGETIINTLFEAGLPKFVFIGSCNEYGNHTGSINEEMTPSGDLNQYTQGKLEVRSIGLKAAKTYNKFFLNIRVFYVYGHGQHENSLINTLYNSFKNNLKVDLDPCEHFRDYSTVYDIAEGIKRIVDLNMSVTLNLGSGRCVKMKDFVSKFWKQLGGNMENLKFGTLDRPVDDADQPRSYANVDRLMDLISWKPDDNIDLGISKTIENLNKYKD